MKLRSIFFWIHLALGGAAGTVILIMSATGVLLKFEKKIVQRAERNVRVVAASNGTPRLTIEELLSKVKVRSAGLPTS